MRAAVACLLLAAGLLLGAAAPAAAAFHPDQVELDRAIKAGDEFWRHDPQNHCLGINGGTIDTTFPVRHETAAGYSVNGVCGTIHILLSRAEQYTRSQFCVLVVHEYGHTINHVHVGDPTNIMYPAPVTAGYHTKYCDYPDPHYPHPHKVPKPRRLTATSAGEDSRPVRPKGLPSSFELLPWTGAANRWR